MPKFFTRHTPVWIVVLFLVLPLLAFPEIVFGRQTLYWTDLSWIHYPRHLFAAREWLAGRVPLWDPYEDTGIPFLAESQVGTLYPLSLLFLSPLPLSRELSLFILVHFSLAGLFTFGLGRLLGQSRAAATLAGLAFGLGGFLMAQVPNLNIMTGATWLPLILLGAILTVRRRRWLLAMLSGLPLAMQLLTAQPQIVFYTLVILAGYGLYRVGADLLGDRAPGRYRMALHTTALLAVLVLSGLALAAPQLLPTLELQQLSVRSQERDFSFLTENSLPPAMWLNLLIPGAFGNNVTGFKGGDPFQEVFVYAGLIPLAMAGLGLGRLLSREGGADDRLFFAFLLAAAALLALGGYTPLYRYVIQYLPGFSLFRIPSRWLMGVNLALAILAGLGLDTMLRRGLSRRAWALLAAALLLAAGLLWAGRTQPGLLGFDQKLAEAFVAKAFGVNPVYRERLLLGRLTAPAFLLLANMGLLLILLAWRATRSTPPGLWASLVILATAADMVIAGGTRINPTRPEAWWQELSGGAQYVLAHAGEARVFPLGMGSEAATVSHLGQYFPSVYGIYSAGGHGSSLRLARYDTFLHEADPVQALRVLGVRYLLTLGQMGADVAATYPLVYADEQSYVYEIKNPLPRAFVVHRAIRANSPEEALTYFQTRSIDPGDTVVLETPTDPPTPAVAPTASTTTIIGEHPQLVEMKASLAAPGYLVLLDTFYPGWQATIDGQETPVYRANTIGRAVFVPAGEHIIRFEYRPLSFLAGQAVALIMLGIMAATAWWTRAGRPDRSSRLESEAA